MIDTLAVHGYRSLRDVVLPLAELTTVTGANGSGKSNLYRAFHLLADTATGRLIGSLAAAGGLSSVLWAGPEQITGAMRRGDVPIQGTGRRLAPVSLQLGFTADEFGYLIDLGLPVPQQQGQTMFGRDPIIKRELIWAGPVLRPAATLLKRTARGFDDVGLPPWASVLDEFADPVNVLDELVDPVHRPRGDSRPRRGARLAVLRQLPGRPREPARQPQVGTRTEVLAGDGHDLAAGRGHHPRIGLGGAVPQAAIADAFDGTGVTVADHGGRFEVALTQRGLLRPLTARELSDGTLRYLLLAAALFSPRPPGLMVLNEPETSLHPDVLPALTRLMVEAARRTQLVVVTHARPLVDALVEAGALHHELVKPHGETEVEPTRDC